MDSYGCAITVNVLAGFFLVQNREVALEDEASKMATVALVVKRRTWIQDIARSYAVIIDGKSVGKMWQFQTRTFEISADAHTVKLAIINTGTASSDVLKIDATDLSKVVVRTTGRGIISAIMTPFAIPAGMKALSNGEPIESRFYKGPWIRTKISLEKQHEI